MCEASKAKHVFGDVQAPLHDQENRTNETADRFWLTMVHTQLAIQLDALRKATTVAHRCPCLKLN